MNIREYEIMRRVEADHWWYRSLRAMLDLMWDRTVAEERPRLLDVGCGTGANLGAFGERAEAMGIDFSPEAVLFCREAGLDSTAVASAVALPFADASFDVAISCDVLCHQSIRNKAAMLIEIHRVLKPGATLLLNVPAYQWLHSSHDIHVQQDKRFTRRETVELLKRCSFEPMHATYWNTLLFPPVLVTRLWRKLRPAATSDLEAGSGQSVNALLEAVLTLERQIATLTALPFGLSIMIAARKR